MYEDKNKLYFSNPRIDLINLIPANKDNKVLEVGAGSCDTLVEIKNLNLATEVVGVELMNLESSQQGNSLIDRLIIGNIENIELDLPENYFDVIICGDVLEHLIDPWATLSKLHKYLNSSGIIIISVPNIREYHILYKILFLKDFRYSSYGILDKTHMRFFCRKNIINLLDRSLYKIVSVSSIFKLEKLRNTKKIIDWWTFGLIRDFLTAQYVVVAKKTL
jgi:2-polyprenyl-3-methyl-5-hydroxy-6-metoxy-1,4-benzoquinol methylase